MKAAIRRTYGSPETISIEEIETPVPGDKEVLVKVMATTVNRTDCANLTAKPFIMRFVLGLRKPRKIIMGTDFAGQVVAKGKDVSRFSLDERVMGFLDIGLQSQAEYVAVPEDKLYAMPQNVSYQQAAASMEGAHYAYSIVHKVAIQPGQSVLINGATGAIGSALLQFVRQFEVHIAATSNTQNMDLIRSLGADVVFDYTREDFTQRPERYDYIFDAVGKSTFGKCKPLLNEGGVYISSELGPYAQNVFFALTTALGGRKKVIFPIPFSPQKTIPYILERLQNETFRPLIDREYALEDIAKAYSFAMSGQKTGNLIVNI